ncbi:guanylate kinase 2, chloroplastic/mitochondrial-like [Vigna umbellata]|uniref:guanylate kinase 2, chloroplastic/mitochondrial-like n=1 Tax=Vigna umbellata TaxID=87088 RepID=UPI001F5E63C6|nr:guanylate kinase 2, chloroplastic/mitochondrial-like [Vigna umbellata]
MLERADLLHPLKASLGSPFSSNPLSPNPNPLIIVISGSNGVGKETLIARFREARRGLRLVVTATSCPRRPTEIDDKDYLFVSKEVFLGMVEREEFLQYALGSIFRAPPREIED